MAKPEYIWALLWDSSFNLAAATMPEMMMLPIKYGRYKRAEANVMIKRQAVRLPQPSACRLIFQKNVMMKARIVTTMTVVR